MRLVTLVCFFILCFASDIPSVIAQCRFGECDVSEGGKPGLTEEDLRLIEAEQAEHAEAEYYDCLLDLEYKYGQDDWPEYEVENCKKGLWILTPKPEPTQTPTPTRVPTAVPSDTAPAAEGEDQGVCLFGLLLC